MQIQRRTREISQHNIRTRTERSGEQSARKRNSLIPICASRGNRTNHLCQYDVERGMEAFVITSITDSLFIYFPTNWIAFGVQQLAWTLSRDCAQKAKTTNGFDGKSRPHIQMDISIPDVPTQYTVYTLYGT